MIPTAGLCFPRAGVSILSSPTCSHLELSRAGRVTSEYRALSAVERPVQAGASAEPPEDAWISAAHRVLQCAED